MKKVTKKKIRKVTARKSYDLQGSIILIHGPPKIGKTQLAASFPDASFVATEPGHKFVSAKKIYSAATLAGAKKAKTALAKRKPGGTVVFDTISGIYRAFKVGICGEYGVGHPSQKGEFGKTIWDVIGDTFASWLSEVVFDLVEKGTTVVFIDHTTEREIETASETVIKVMCGMSGQARKFVTPLPDHIWFMGYGEKEDSEDDTGQLTKNFSDNRVLWLQGGNTVEAGCRDSEMSVKRICPLKKPNTESRTGGYFQIIEEMA